MVNVEKHDSSFLTIITVNDDIVVAQNSYAVCY